MTVQNGVVTSYKLGATLKDTGFSRESTQVRSGKTIGGAYNFIQSSSTEKMLITLNNSGDSATELWFKTDVGSWTEIAGDTTAFNVANQIIEMEGFIGYCFFVGADSSNVFLPVASLTGTTLSTSTNVGSMPQAKYIKRYRDRLYLANCKISSTSYPFRVYYSDVPSGGTLTWTPATNFFDVDFSDYITGIVSNWDKLIVFTKFKTYFYDQSSSKQAFDIGCSAHRTIITHGAYTGWINTDGAWLCTGGQPQNISGDVIDFFYNATPANMFSALVDEEWWIYIGTVTVNGIGYSNCCLVYNFKTDTWRTRELNNTQSGTNYAMKIFARYDSPTRNRRLFMGDANGNLWNKAKYTDSTLISEDGYTTSAGTGNDIAINFELAPLAFGQASLVKEAAELNFFSDRGQGLNIRVRVLDRNGRALTKYKAVGQLSDFITAIQVPMMNGNLLQIAGSESSKLPYFSFFGFEMVLNSDGNILKPKFK